MRQHSGQGRGAVAAAVLASVLFTVGGCTGDRTAPSAGPGSAASDAAAEVTRQAFASTPRAEALGTVTGTMVRQQGQQTAEVLSVQTSAEGTTLRWRLKSADGRAQTLAWLWGVAPLSANEPLGDLRAVRLTTTDGTYYLATIYDRIRHGGKSSTYCLCSLMPHSLPAGGAVELYGFYPPLPTGTATVTVQIAGLPDITNIPVTKADT